MTARYTAADLVDQQFNHAIDRRYAWRAVQSTDADQAQHELAHRRYWYNYGYKIGSKPASGDRLARALRLLCDAQHRCNNDQ